VDSTSVSLPGATWPSQQQTLRPKARRDFALRAREGGHWQAGKFLKLGAARSTCTTSEKNSPHRAGDFWNRTGRSVPKRCVVIAVHPLIVGPIGPVPISRPAVFRCALELVFGYTASITAWFPTAFWPRRGTLGQTTRKSIVDRRPQGDAAAQTGPGNLSGAALVCIHRPIF
jgi:hypothetical protein